MSEEKNYFGFFDAMRNSGKVMFYDPSIPPSMEDFESIFKDEPKPRQYTMFGSRNTIDLMSGDPVRVAEANRRMRVDKFRRYKQLIVEYGIEAAKTIGYLDKHYGTAWHSKRWNVWMQDSIYKGIRSSDEYSSVSMKVYMNEETKFKIVIEAGSQVFWGTKDEYSHIDTLNENISYKSVINQINYFLRKFKA